MKGKILGISVLALPGVIAQEEGDMMLAGFELEKILNLGSGLLAIGLFIITLIAYRRNRNQRLVYVGAAFLLFAIKTLLLSMEIFFGDWSWIDPFTSVLDFAILVSFFLGLLKK